VGANGVRLTGVSVINAGGPTAAAIAWVVSTADSTHNIMDHVSIQCIQTASSYCLAGVYLGSNNTSDSGYVSLNTFSDTRIAGYFRCGIEIEGHADTNSFFGAAVQNNPKNTYGTDAAAICLNTSQPTVDIDADANLFVGVSQTGTPYSFSLGQTSGNLFLDTNLD
jgi:hypothetical protein